MKLHFMTTAALELTLQQPACLPSLSTTPLLVPAGFSYISEY